MAFSGLASFDGYIDSDLATLRIVFQKALAELEELEQEQEQYDLQLPTLQESLTKQETRKASLLERLLENRTVLDWAATTLRTRFGLPDSEIDYELHGHLSTQRLGLPRERAYSRQTLLIWRAFGGHRREWAFAQEATMRNFAGNKLERQRSFEAVPSAERRLLHSLAADLGLVSQSFGEEAERAVTVAKTMKSPNVPIWTVDEATRKRRLEARMDLE